jgi:hypothetical protein
MKTPTKWYVGQTVLRVTKPFRRGQGPALAWRTVTKVGTKYVTCKDPQYLGDNLAVQYHKDTGAEKTDFTIDSYIYASPEDWQEQTRESLRDDAIFQEIHRRHNWTGKLSIETKLAILKDLGVEDPPPPELPELPPLPKKGKKNV